MNNLIKLVCIFFVIGGCKKEYLPGALNEISFDCPTEESIFYFEGDMEDEHFCYHNEVNGYEIEFSTTTGLITTGPELGVSPNDIDTSNSPNSRMWVNLGFRPKAVFEGSPIGEIPHLKHWLVIESPTNTVGTLVSKIISENIKNIEELPLQSDKISSDDGFNINFRFNNLEKNRSDIFEARGGNQEGSFLRITELDIQESPTDIKQYTVTFEFECNLYYYGEPNQFYKRLRNGIMKIQFEI